MLYLRCAENAVRIKVGIIFQKFEVFIHAEGMVYSSLECVPAFGFINLYVGVLLFKGNVGDQKDFCITGYLIGISARQFDGITVQVVEHISNSQTASELLEDNNVLSLMQTTGRK